MDLPRAGSPAPPSPLCCQFFLLIVFPLLFLPSPFPVDPSLPTNTLPQSPEWKNSWTDLNPAPHKHLLVNSAARSWVDELLLLWTQDFLDSNNISLGKLPPPHHLFLQQTLPVSFWRSHRDVSGPSPVGLHVAVSISICHPPLQVTHKSAVPPTASDFQTAGNIQHLVDKKASLWETRGAAKTDFGWIRGWRADAFLLTRLWEEKRKAFSVFPR